MCHRVYLIPLTITTGCLVAVAVQKAACAVLVCSTSCMVVLSTCVPETVTGASNVKYHQHSFKGEGQMCGGLGATAPHACRGVPHNSPQCAMWSQGCDVHVVMRQFDMCVQLQFAATTWNSADTTTGSVGAAITLVSGDFAAVCWQPQHAPSCATLARLLQCCSLSCQSKKSRPQCKFVWYQLRCVIAHTGSIIVW